MKWSKNLFFISLIAVTSTSYDTKKIVQDFRLSEDEENLILTFNNLIDQPYSTLGLTINRNYHEEFNTKAGENKILISKNYIDTINDISAKIVTNTQYEYPFNFKYISNDYYGCYHVLDKFYISNIQEMDKDYILLYDNRYIQVSDSVEYIYTHNYKFSLFELGNLICNFYEVEDINFYIEVDSKYVDYPYDSTNGIIQIPIVLKKKENGIYCFSYKDKLFYDKYNSVSLLKGNEELGNDIILKKGIDQEKISIKILAKKNINLLCDIYWEKEIKISDSVIYPSDLFGFIL